MNESWQLQEWWAGCWMWRKSGTREELEAELARRLEQDPKLKLRVKEKVSTC